MNIEDTILSLTLKPKLSDEEQLNQLKLIRLAPYDDPNFEVLIRPHINRQIAELEQKQAHPEEPKSKQHRKGKHGKR